MKKSPLLSLQSHEALALFATLLETARRERQMSQAELAERAGISRATVQAVLKGEPQVAIGTVFEVAALLGTPLFNIEPGHPRLTEYRELLEARLALLPKHIHPPKADIDDDF
ncbi:MAG: helix-turn-helix transcriptional regulator [Candidatus Competibacteraceae bacterium]|nr:helix-turn-helix transcriptional regulator [Candidatus Competibacteraceae bacterium]MCP5126025.1 helix-turn-helix transcriptional regulator [Gammaproteobacteria bacterium]